MNVTGPSGSGLPAAYRANAAARVGAPAPAAPARPAAPAAPPTAAARPAATDVPEGSDPALWAVLTAEERSFFQRQAALGPLTYGRGAKPAPSTGAPVGGRIDVKA
jgi:hypothetical protein